MKVSKTSAKQNPAQLSVRVEKGAPVHARGMRALIGIGIGVRQRQTFDAMHLDFELDCGTAYLQTNGGDFAVSITTCFIDLDLVNCEVLPRSRYEHRLSVGDVDYSR